jgi:two-component system, NtrC family, sensor histidine kinase HydH
MRVRLVSSGIALLVFAALSVVCLVIYRGMAERARLVSRNDGEQTISVLFAGLREHEDFGAAIESRKGLRTSVIGVAVYAAGGRIYGWGDSPAQPPRVPAVLEERHGMSRAYIENPKNSSLQLLLMPGQDRPPPPGRDSTPQDTGRPAGSGSFMQDVLARADLIFLEVRQPELWRFHRLSALLLPVVEIIQAAAVAFVTLLILRNRQYRARIEEQKNLVMLGSAASTLAHEIKNPLLAIRLQTGILERTLGEEGRREIAIINDEVGRLSALSHRVNDILRDPAGMQEATDPARAAREVGSRLCGREVLHSPAPEGLRVRIDPERLRSILENLLRNALESGGPETEVAVEIAHSEGKAKIDVLDRGQGISAVDRQRIFDPFFTTKSKGSGIGLTICRRFTEAAGGTVILENRAGGGCRARVTLPAAAARGGPA